MDEIKRGMFHATGKCYRAVIKKEWKKVEEEFTKKNNPAAIKFPVTSSNDLALHLAVYSGKEEPTRELLSLLVRNLEKKEEDIEGDFWKNNEGNTPLHEARLRQ
uniref:Uncharacterized protein n=1 Tax=Cucumis sativus TaxID=3659 RepID=A0A0A0LYI0_CUCSA